MSELLPLFPLSTVLFPGMRLPLHIFEPRYRQLATYLQEQPEPRRFGVIAIRKGREVGADGITALYDVGCVARVRQISPHPDGRFDLSTVGTERFRLLRVDDSLPYFQGEIETLPEEELPGAVEIWMRSLSDVKRSTASVRSIAAMSTRTLTASTARTGDATNDATRTTAATATYKTLKRRPSEIRAPIAAPSVEPAIAAGSTA